MQQCHDEHDDSHHLRPENFATIGTDLPASFRMEPRSGFARRRRAHVPPGAVAMAAPLTLPAYRGSGFGGALELTYQGRTVQIRHGENAADGQQRPAGVLTPAELKGGPVSGGCHMRQGGLVPDAVRVGEE